MAIIYHYLAHYREAVFEALSGPDARHRYEIFADRESNVSSIQTMTPDKSRWHSGSGRLNWRFIRNRWLAPQVLWQSEALRIALSRDFDTIIFLGNMRFLSTWIAAVLARMRGKRVLMWTHGVLRDERGIHGLVRRTFYRLAHGLLLYGARARTLLAARGFAPERLYVVYNSLDTAAQLRALRELDAGAAARVRRQFGIPQEAPLLITIGRLVSGKDLHLLPAALAKLRSQGLPVHLLFVGDGPARLEIETLVGDLELEGQVHFAGPLYLEAELCPLITTADLCVSPGAVGLTAMHALIYGTPIITHDQLDAQKPEFEAIQPGMTGAFFRRGDAGHLADTIGNWLTVGRDRALVGAVCRERLLRFYTPENQRRIIDMAVDGLPATMLERPTHESDRPPVQNTARPLGL